MRINTDRFVSTQGMAWMSNERRLVSEASDLGLDPYRLYDDACDYGLWVKSHHTGKLEPFNYVGPEYDREGDVISWSFSNTSLAIVLVVYND